MRILFTSTPLEGHINPLWRYAEALRGAGHEVRFAASEKARASVEKRGFAPTPVADPSEDESKRVWAMLDACSADEKADELAQEMAAMTPMAHAVDLIETFSR